MDQSGVSLIGLTIFDLMSDQEHTSDALSALVACSFELECEAPFAEAQLLQLLADRIAYLATHNPEYLFSLLYRNDIAEEKIAQALSLDQPQPANIALARLVLERQKERLATRQRYQSPPLDEDADEELLW